MALHDRLKNPTLEQAPAKGHGLIVMAALAVMTAAFAYAMPGLQNVSAETEDPSLVVVESPTGSTHTPTADATPTPNDEDADGKADNHGKVVSTAAHCDIKGKAHGELVRSIAKDKEATVADAEAACEAALAAEGAGGAEGSNHGRGDEAKAPKTERVKPAKPSRGHHDEAGDTDESESEGTETEPETEDFETAEEHGKPDKGKP